MAEIWFFSHKNLGCCLIGHLHICLLSPVHRLSSFIILSFFVSLCLSVFLWPCLSVFVRISSSLVHLISYQFIGFFLGRTSLSGIEWMGLDWSSLHCIGHRFPKSTFGANKIFNINGLPGVWKWLNGYQLQRLWLPEIGSMGRSSTIRALLLGNSASSNPSKEVRWIIRDHKNDTRMVQEAQNEIFHFFPDKA